MSIAREHTTQHKMKKRNDITCRPTNRHIKLYTVEVAFQTCGLHRHGFVLFQIKHEDINMKYTEDDILDAYIIPAMYTCSKVGSMIGGVGFNYLGDRFGRKPIFWLTTSMVVLLMTVKTFVSQYYYAYAALKILAATTFISIFQLPFSIICEVSDGDYRTWAILVSWLVW